MIILCRIKTTYNQFELNSLFEEQIELGPNSAVSTVDESTIFGAIHSMNDPVDIINSSDEDEGKIDQIKYEP